MDYYGMDYWGWLMLALFVILVLTHKHLIELAEYMNNRRGGGPPTHPLPATGRIENTRPSRRSQD